MLWDESQDGQAKNIMPPSQHKLRRHKDLATHQPCTSIRNILIIGYKAYEKTTDTLTTFYMSRDVNRYLGSRDPNLLPKPG